MVNYRLFIVLSFFILLQGCRLTAQEIPERLRTGYGPLDEKLSTLVTVDSLAISARRARTLDAKFIDAREPEEFRVSHLPGALPLGYKSPDYAVLNDLDKDRPLVVYCTVGYRSERIAKELRERGFTRVYNLFGSLYAWKLAGYELVNAQGPTEQLHTYNRKWGSFVPDSIGEKVY